MMEAMAPWSDLPKELVERISKFVNSHIDILRIRAVCSSWRSAFSPNFKIPKPQFPIKLPYNLPFPHEPMFWTTDLKSHCYLIESTVYLFQLPHPPHTGWLAKILKTAYEGVKILNPLTNRVIDDLPDKKLNLIESTVYLFQLPHPPHTGWLAKILKTAYEGVKILNPLTNRVIDDLPDKKLNLLDLRVSQVCKFYHVHWVLDYHSHCLLGYDLFNKILPIWNNQTNQFSVMATSIFDHLLCFKSGDDKWTTLKDPTSKIVDISVYKGNFYVVDTYGETIMYDPSSFNETNVSSNVKGLSSSIFNGWGSKKRLVESGGELFLVDMFLDTDVKTELHGSQPSWKCPKEIKVYRLDEEQHEWIAVHTLGDRIFFAGDDCCFSVASSDFGDQCAGNCIYYENGGIIVDILGVLLPERENYDDDFEDDCVCGVSCRYPFEDEDPILVDDDDDDAPILVDGGVKLSNNGDDGNDNENDDNNDDSPILIDGVVKLSNNDGKIYKNDFGGKSSGGLSEEVKLRYKGLHGHHTGIFSLQDGKLGSLLSFLEYADIFWPPPSWLFTDDDQAASKKFLRSVIDDTCKVI